MMLGVRLRIAMPFLDCRGILYQIVKGNTALYPRTGSITVVYRRALAIRSKRLFALGS
jgi:hypothetical protein